MYVCCVYHSRGVEYGVMYIHMGGVFVYTGYIQVCGYIHVFGLVMLDGSRRVSSGLYI